MSVHVHWPGVAFTPTEARLLAYLLDAPDRTASAAELLEHVWGYDSKARTRTVSTTIWRLRKKIEQDPERPEQLVFLRGHGYALHPPDRQASTAEQVRRRLQDWLGPDQDWVALLTREGGGGRRLPSAMVELVGREHALQRLVERILGPERLLTVHGSAGLGKTSLALAAGRAVQDDVAGGAWWCELGLATSAAELVEAVARALGVQGVPTADRPRSDQVAQVLRHLGPSVLLLDNVEQIEADAEDALIALLEAAPELTVVTTSRRRLGLHGEGVVPLRPLTLEAGTALLQRRILEATGEPAERDSLRDIAALLEGVPLALEMAAARSRLMSLRELHARLQRSFQVLRSPRGRPPPRHRTMQAAFESSWSLLRPGARRALVDLSVFPSSFPIEAAEHVLGEDQGLERLAELVDHAMVRRVHGGRLAIFHTLRQFALDRPDVDEAPARARLAAWALRVVAREAPRLDEEPGPTRVLLGEMPALMEAHSWLLESQDPRAFSLIEPLVQLFISTGTPAAYVARLEQTRAAVPLEPAEHVRLHLALALALCMERAYDRARIEYKRGLARADAHPVLRADLLGIAAFDAFARGDAQACDALAIEAEQLALDAGRQDKTSWYLRLRAATSNQRGDHDLAEALARRAIGVAERRGARRRLSALKNILGAALAWQGRGDEAMSCFEQAALTAETFGSAATLYSVRLNIAELARRRGDFRRAHEAVQALLRDHARYGARSQAGQVPLQAGQTALMVGERALARAAFESALRETRAIAASPAIATMARAFLLLCLVADGEDRRALELADGLASARSSPIARAAREELDLCLSVVPLARARLAGQDLSLALEPARSALQDHRSERSGEAAAAARVVEDLLRSHAQGPRG